MSERIRLGTPYPDGGVVGWMTRYAKKNYWRVAPWMDLSDLIQDGFACYYKCCSKYPDKPPSHRMALFKTIYANHITDLANKRTGLGEIDVSPGVDKDSWLANALTDPAPSLQELAVLVQQAPAVLKGVLAIFADPMLIEKFRRPNARVDGLRETTNHRICTLLRDVGIIVDPEQRDVADEIRAYLSADSL